jgi:superfamily II RNA helicase
MTLVSTTSMLELTPDQWLETADDSEPYISYNKHRTPVNDVFSSHESITASRGTNSGSSFLRMLERSTHLDRSPHANLAQKGFRPSPTSSSMGTPENIRTPTPIAHPERARFTATKRVDPPTSATTNISLLSTAAVLPDRLRSFFPFQYFNAMQSEAFHHIYDSDQNVVLSAPTASGKTTCFDMAIARLMQNEVEPKSFKVLSHIFK